MITLYKLLAILLACALVLLAVPFVARKRFFSKSFLGLMMFVIVFSLGLYQISSDKAALKQWLEGGSQHYVLIEKFEQLGGVDGAIRKIEERLKQNPSDTRGWMILGKLYQSRGEDKRAAEAFARGRNSRVC